ncbi:radical SAM protein [Methanosarcina mazei]|jgi:radical SAM superfamily enzyme with C-terminal helix-hairpin-helix motif|uniref:Fe-S oxidoreductase n=8 Tax=Methanosarcina mazei TaxID=2209 RepID=A0A0F8P8A3_METMZ|nr:radical SAM protein [Methanosarcina mazei]AAM29917.1 Fe-S oxidoreductase [Methanosarcina mazei Go1]AKB40056.1 Radical SAM superfamily protein [Methanosarcina mazei WWM610]AKB64275.1 Radical SAM superfamily protein [Methanosarcina mazei S-6]AKB67632.1 Radical SAM superfamily protein [Methanosarcina mazei LYC]AKB72332.1 Radical SAM superfamily protein [Methanosarcina mazei C16]
MKALIIDGYVDEPACLGVPPYLSPYPRYIAGALRERGLSENDIHYLTIDTLRENIPGAGELIGKADLVVIIAGMTVPGKYLRASPISPGEIEAIFGAAKGIKVMGGPIRLGFSSEGGRAAKGTESGISLGDAVLAKMDIEAFIYDLFEDGIEGERSTGSFPVRLKDQESIEHRFRTTSEIGCWGVRGAFLIRQHPDYPHCMCELETYRGCGRKVHCSFCTEPFYGSSDYRPVEDVVSEVSALYSYGARYFRIGRQPDLFSYHGTDAGGPVPKPVPEVLERLYKGIRNSAPGLSVLHMDNANPITLATYPEESEQILKTIVKFHTPGDVAAFGMETADPAVVAANSLKATSEEVFEAIRLVNRFGAVRGANGLPEILPGINFVHGLMGETKKTFQLNYAFLQKVLDSGLLLRRINIRQVMAFPGTPMYGRDEAAKKHKKLFLDYKERVRKNIDLPMLRKVVPEGTVLRDVMCEVHDREITFGRQIGSYPLLVGIPSLLPLRKFTDITVTGHGMRSITGIPYPLHINSASLTLIRCLPGIGKKAAASIAAGVPYSNRDDFLKRVSEGEKVIDFIEI